MDLGALLARRGAERTCPGSGRSLQLARREVGGTSERISCSRDLMAAYHQHHHRA